MGLLGGIGKQISGVAKTLGATKAGKAVSKGGSFLKKNGPSLLRRFGNDDASLITNPVGGFLGKFPIVSSVLKGMGDAQEKAKKNKAEAESIPSAGMVNSQMRNLSGRTQEAPMKPMVGSGTRATPNAETIDKNVRILGENLQTMERNARSRASVQRNMTATAASVVSDGLRKNAKLTAEQKATPPPQPQQQGGLPPQQTTPEGAEEEGGFNSSNESFLDKLISGGVEVFISALTRWAGPLILPVYLGFRKLGKYLGEPIAKIFNKFSRLEEIPEMISNLWSKIVGGLSDMGDTLLTSFREALPSWMPGSLSSKEARKHREERAKTKSLKTEAKKLRSAGENRLMYGYDEGFRDERNLENIEQSALESSEKAISDMGDNPPEVKKLVEKLKGYGAYEDNGELKSGFDVNSLSLEDLDALLDTKFRLYGFAGDKYKNLLGDPSTLTMTEKAYLLRLPAPSIFFKEDGYTIDSGKTQQDLAGKLMKVSSAFALMTNVAGAGKGRYLVRPPASRLFDSGLTENQFDALAKNPKFTLKAISPDDELYDRYLGNALIKRTETPWGIGDEQVIVHNGIPYLITEVEEGGATAQGVSETPSVETAEATAEATNISETPSTPQKVGAEEIYNQLVDDMLADDMAENISDIKEAQEEAKKNPPKSITNNNTVIQPTEKTTEVRYVTDNYTGSSEDTGLG